MTAHPHASLRRLPLAISVCTALLAGHVPMVLAQVDPDQVQPTTDEDSTVTYPASYFDQYQPFSVNDMLARIPGIDVARGGGGPSGGPGSSGGSGRRGLGAGSLQRLDTIR